MAYTRSDSTGGSTDRTSQHTHAQTDLQEHSIDIYNCLAFYMQYYIHGVSHCRQRISSSMKFSISIDTDPGITDTIGTITCPLSSAPDGGCLSYELVALLAWMAPTRVASKSSMASWQRDRQDPQAVMARLSSVCGIPQVFRFCFSPSL